MDEIILHHYPPSPVSEKVRVALGIKGLSWRSVEIPRLPPKPDVMPLTGGYRRTPIMQVGADIYCDSQCILRELQRRHPEPSFYPGGAAGLPWGISRWTDALFDTAVRLSMGANADKLPADFAKDRLRLFFGPNGDIKKVQADLAHTVAQCARSSAGWKNASPAAAASCSAITPGCPTHSPTISCGSYAGAGKGDRDCCRNSPRWKRGSSA